MPQALSKGPVQDGGRKEGVELIFRASHRIAAELAFPVLAVCMVAIPLCMYVCMHDVCMNGLHACVYIYTYLCRSLCLCKRIRRYRYRYRYRSGYM